MRTTAPLRSSLTLLLLLIPKALADDEDTDFLMNVFSDLGPVLALFGEQFARQFLSETFTWYDHLIFACVPLGIMTAITGAIRVEGRGVLKAFIGRARENKAAAEIDYMSSTSAEVGELFNGKGIVRTMGQSKIAQFIVFPQLCDRRRRLKKRRRVKASLICIAGAHVSILDYRDDLDMRFLKMFKSRPKSRQEEPEDGIFNKGIQPKYWDSLRYPNLQLNIAAERITAMQRSVELHLAAIAAIVLQASLLAIAVAVPYQVRGFDRQPWGLPCYIGGSVLLFFGMLACSVAIERSTKEYKWFPNNLTTTTSTANKREQHMDLFWVQGKQRVSDQEFGSYIIYAQNKDFVSTSSRKEDVGPKRNEKLDQNDSRRPEEKLEISGRSASRYRDIRALTALLAGGAGFTIQFIGLRGLPWPVAVAHLGAIIVMAVIRALIRRRLGENTHHCIVPSGYELDFLAIQLVETNCRRFPCLEEDSRSRQQVLSWRVDTAKHGNGAIYSFDFPDTDEANAAGLERHDQYKRRQDKDTLNKKAQKIISVRKRWNQKRSMEDSRHNIGIVELKIVKQDKGWKINAGEVEAVLSLWMANLEANNMARADKDKQTEWQRSKAGIALGVDYCRILGRKYSNGALQRDVDWWVGNPATSEIKTEVNQEAKGPQLGPGNMKIAIGFTGTANDSKSPTLLVQHSTAGPATIVAQHLFTHFIWFIVDRVLPKDFLDQGSILINESVSIQPAKQLDVRSSKPGTGRKLRHNKLTQLALHGEKEGLGSLNDILLCIIPVLSIKDCLPNDVTLQVDLPRLSDRKSWSRAIPRYSELLNFVAKSTDSDLEDYLTLSVVVYTLDLAYLISLDGMNMSYEKGSRHKSTKATKSNSKSTEKLGRSVNTDQSNDFDKAEDTEDAKNGEVPQDSQDTEGSEALTDSEQSAISETKDSEKEFTAPSTDPTISTSGQSDDSQKLLIQLSKSFPKVIKKLSKFYALQGRGEFLSILGYAHEKASKNAWPELREFPGFMGQIRFTKTHREIYEANQIDLTKLQGKDLEKRDIFGWTILHYAAACREFKIIGGAPVNRPGRWWFDNFDRSPIHVASLVGNVQFLDILLASLSKKDGQSALQCKGLDGMTPVHLAIAGGHEKCVQVFMKLPYISQVEMKEDAWQRNPIHLAIAQGQYECCTALINNKKIQFDPNNVDALAKSLFYYLDAKNVKQKEVGTILLEKHSSKFGKSDNEGQSIWHHAVKFLSHDSIDILQKEHKLTIDSRDKAKESPLHLAVRLNMDEMVNTLLSLGAEPSVNMEKDQSPLMLACIHGRSNMVRSMLEHDEQAAKEQDKKGKTALHYVVDSKDCNEDDREIIVKQLVSAMKKVDVEDRQSRTPLHIACGNSIVSAVSIFLESGADPKTKDKSGYNALHHAVHSWPHGEDSSKERMLEITKTLLEKAPDCMNAPDNNGHTPLTKACEQGSPLDFVSLAVELSDQEESKLELDQGDSNFGEPPLAWACEWGHTEVVKKLLLAKRLDVNKKAEFCHDFTPLRFALGSGNAEIVQLLIAHRRFVYELGTIDRFGRNIAQFALERVGKACLTVLLLHEKTGSATFSNCGWERVFQSRPNLVEDEAVLGAFERLAQLGRYDKIKSLLANDKNSLGLDEDGWTPADVAGRYGYKDLEGLIRPHEPARDMDVIPYCEPSTFISLFKGPEIKTSNHSSHDVLFDRILAVTIPENDWSGSQVFYLRTKEAIPPNAKFFYFEVEILRSWHDSFVTRPCANGSNPRPCIIGFCQSYVPEDQLPGWHGGSFAYYGDDGNFFVSQDLGTRQESDEPFEKGDIVGCGLNLETGQGYRTKNGVLLGSSPEFQDRKFLAGKFYPCFAGSTNGQEGDLQLRVTLQSSPEHPFRYSGPYNGLLLRVEWPKVDRVTDQEAEETWQSTGLLLDLQELLLLNVLNGQELGNFTPQELYAFLEGPSISNITT
ncbi:hypothetical protein FGRMN_2125 [Fusarium graminum]|nr:hypothetical protein FGRMN_2125 [Fusarium graminum]